MPATHGFTMRVSSAEGKFRLISRKAGKEHTQSPTQLVPLTRMDRNSSCGCLISFALFLTGIPLVPLWGLTLPSLVNP